jgi:hypothetical protein
MNSVKVTSILLLILLVTVTSSPVGVDYSTINTTSFQSSKLGQHPTSAYIANVPYVWQEVNGYCMSAALSMVLQSMGMNLDLHDLFVTMGTGFSALYMGVDETRYFIPGVLIRQPVYFQFFTDLYGLELTTYANRSEAFGSFGASMYDMLGLQILDYANSSTQAPFDVIRESISAGIPLAIAADLYYLPPHDYDIFRQYGAPLTPGGTAHAITIVGYNDISRDIYIQDPGVGLFEDDFGYPEDGRWNYTMPYDSFETAWRSAGYLTFRVSSSAGPADDFNTRLGRYICNKLCGDRTDYFEGVENYYFLSPGMTAFSGMAYDLTVQCISDYARYFKEVDKSAALKNLGHISEMFMTIQYHGFRGALNSIPRILSDVDLVAFIDAADDALPHFEVLTSNSSLTSGVGVISRNTLFFSTFEEIATNFQTSGDLEESISQQQEQLDDIRGHLFAIAEAWEAAADVLEVTLQLQSGDSVDGSLLILFSGAGVIVLIVIILFLTRKK